MTVVCAVKRTGSRATNQRVTRMDRVVGAADGARGAATRPRRGITVNPSRMDGEAPVVANGPVALRFATAAGHLIRRAQQVHTELWAATVGSALTGPQYATLVAVAGWPDVDQKRAAELASLDKSTTAGVVSRLEKKGWLTRRAHPQDARRRLLVLTDRAHSDLPALTAAAGRVQELLMEPLGPQHRERFVELLQTVAFGSRRDVLAAAPIHRDKVLEMSTTPGYLIRRAQQVHFAIWNAILAGDLTSPQYAVLTAAANSPSVDQALIGAQASLDSSSVADIVARLADKGWLTRSRDPLDRRRMLVDLTQPAVAAMRHLTRSVEQVQHELLKGLSAEQATDFVAMMQRVARIRNEDMSELSAAS
jgi:DNA-binding MarR family transcriptional regulator